MDLGVRSLGNSGLGTVYLALTMYLGSGDRDLCSTEEEPGVQRGPVTCSMSEEQS